MCSSKRVFRTARPGGKVRARGLWGTAIVTLLPASVSLFCATAQAQTWTGAADNSYANALNWAPAVVPNGAGATATFADGPSALSINLGQTFNVSGFDFNANTSAYTINIQGPSGFLTVGGTGFINAVPTLPQMVRVGPGAGLSFEGTATIQDVIVQVDPSGTFMITDDASGGNARMIVNGTAIIAPGPGNPTFGSLEGSGSVQIGAGATLITGMNDRSSTFAGSFSGDGSLEVAGDGIFTVTGASSLGGDLTVCCSHLVVNGSFNVGGDAIVNGGSLTVSTGGWLNVSGAAGTMDGDIIVKSGGRLDASAFGMVLGGDFTVADAGSVARSGVASFASLLTPGNLTVSNGGRLETLGDAEIGINVTANVDGAGSLWSVGQTLYVGDDSVGPGFLSLTNGGRLSAGAVSIAEDSTLQIGSGSSAGVLSTTSVTSAGALIFNHSDNIIFGASVSGSGTLSKQGAGSLTLTGASIYTGGTQIQGGTLRIDGSLASSVTVGSGATLAGSGTIGGMTALSGGSVAPGNVNDPLNVRGDVLFYAGSAFVVAATPAGQSDRIDADGKATLQGGTVQVRAGQGTYNPSTTYTILTSKGGLSGRFSGVTSNLAFLTPSLTYGANSVTMTLTRASSPIIPVDPLPFHSVALTRNQYVTADAIDALGKGNPVFNAVLSQTVSGARQAFDALSGEMHASAVTSAYQDADLLQGAVLGRLNRSPQSSLVGNGPRVLADYAADRPGAVPQVMTLPAFDQRRFAFWGEGFGAWGKTRSDGDAASIDRSTGGFILGAETKFNPAYLLGAAAGYIRTKADAASRYSSETNESIFGTLYGSATWGPLALRLGTSYARHDFDTTRHIFFPLFSDTTTASYGGSTFQTFGEAGYRLGWGWGHVEPFVGASILRLHTASYQENGGAAALTGYGSSYNLGTTTLGIRAEAQFGDDNAVTLRGMVGWRRAYGDIRPTALMAFAGGASAFTISGVPLDQDTLVGEAGIDWQATQSLSLGASYTGQIGARSQEHALKGNLTLRF
ncbi:autotransporter outer membrane beta-barrel domain-containing protein [Microvirga rosea]|uniref:autotransporter outer membrane beta-barrel domain-containing protein n=1 Tax=Microvirga rosea TaxID=2715425 RepID=UPI001D0B91F6|nr:autotransporter domain-containing protein [Microvirga rosea]MCB8822136.1 autotransporter domain-containing protein [Microvirga rosea]